MLIDALHNAMQNWGLAGIICQVMFPPFSQTIQLSKVIFIQSIQAMWNYLIDSPNIVDLLGENDTEFLAGTLSEYLDDETLFNGERPDQIWEQFAIVATDLLERIQTAIPYSPHTSSDEDELHITNKTKDYWGGQFRTWLDNE